MADVDRDILPWPEANARVGDDVWFRADPATEWQTDWYVAAVGVTVAEGQRFDIEIKRAGAEGDGLVVCPFPPADPRLRPYEGTVPPQRKAQVLVIPKPPPPSVARLLGKYPDLLAVRSGDNRDGCHVRLLCRRCWCWLIVVSTTVTTGDLAFQAQDDKDDGDFVEQCPGLSSNETRVACGCDHAVYAVRFTSCLGVEEGSDSE